MLGCYFYQHNCKCICDLRTTKMKLWLVQYTFYNHYYCYCIVSVLHTNFNDESEAFQNQHQKCQLDLQYILAYLMVLSDQSLFTFFLYYLLIFN